MGNLTIQPKLEFSSFVEEGVANGTIEIVGGVARYIKTKQIVEWGKNVANISNSSRIWIGVTVGAAALGIVGYFGYKFFKKYIKSKKQSLENNGNKVINKYCICGISEYVYQINNQTMSLSTIEKMLNFFNSYSKNKDLKIEISDNEMVVLRNIFTRYTVELCKVNNVRIENQRLSIDAKEQTKCISLEEIKEALLIQIDIFKKNDKNS